MQIIDFHTHIFPDKIAENAILSLETLTNTKSYIKGDISSLKKEMKKWGIATSVVLPIATKPSQCQTINNFAESINGTKEFFSFGSIHPDYDYKQELKRIVRLGIKGIKIHPDYQHFYIDAPEIIRMLYTAAELGLIIVTHAGFDTGYPAEPKCTPSRLRNTLDELKGATVVAAHMGSFKWLDDVLNYLAETDVYIETSQSIVKDSPEKLINIFKHFNIEHILFGTDSPWRTHEETLNKLEEFVPENERREKILYKNAQKLLGFEG